MLQIEQDFLRAIKQKDNRFVLLCMEKGLTANVCDEKGNSALEYALEFDNELFIELAEHKKTTKETLGKALDYIEAQRLSNEHIIAYKKWEKEASFLQKLIDIIIFQKGIELSINATKVYRSLYIKQQFLYELYQKERN